MKKNLQTIKIDSSYKLKNDEAFLVTCIENFKTSYKYLFSVDEDNLAPKRIFYCLLISDSLYNSLDTSIINKFNKSEKYEKIWQKIRKEHK